MKKTDITIILDRSGSMQSTANDAIGGFNTFLKEQQALPGEACLTLIQFDDQYEVNYAETPIKSVKALTHETFKPRGSTALVDAMGRGISDLKARIKAIPKEDRPNVVVVIITDGEENCSREWTMDRVNELITKRQAKGWQFVFIGANQDAIKTAQGFGIQGANSLSYASNSIGTQSLFTSVSKNVAAYRSGAKADMSFDAQDIKMQADAGVVNGGKTSA